MILTTRSQNQIWIPAHVHGLGVALIILLVFNASMLPAVATLMTASSCSDGCSPVQVQFSCTGVDEVLTPGSLPIVVHDSSIPFHFVCLANEPTEWIYEWDSSDTSGPNGQRRVNLVYATGLFTNPPEVYWAHLALKFEKLVVEESLLCRAVANHSNNVEVIMKQPNATNSTVLVTQFRDVDVPMSPDTASHSCPVTLHVAKIGDGYFFQCRDGHGRMNSNSRHVYDYSGCGTSPLCAIMLRSIKLSPNCIVRTHSATGAGWSAVATYTTFYRPGVVACSILDGGGLPKRAAFEFFISGARTGRPVLHFSLSEVDLRDFIWFDPPPSKYYYYRESERESVIFETRCHVSKYGFAADLRLDITLNGSHPISVDVINWKDGNEDTNTHISSKIVLNFTEHGPGFYQLSCGARVWNTTELVTHTINVQAVRAVQPYFETSVNNVTFTDGEKDLRLDCDVQGSPLPAITWENLDLLPETTATVEDDQLVLPILTPNWNNTNIICTGSNRFGHATKRFILYLKDGNAEYSTGPNSESASLPVAAIVSIAFISGIAFVGLVALGVLYFRYRWFRRKSRQALSPEEMTTFINGDAPYSPVISIGMSMSMGGDQAANPELEEHSIRRQSRLIECLPYNSQFEVPQSDMFVNLKKKLGSGQYGVVFEGTLKGKPVAFKTVRPFVPIEYFKALMSELKILAFIGHHENIVNLIGTNTSKIASRQLLMAMELCKISLLEHLASCKKRMTGRLQSIVSFSDQETSSSASVSASSHGYVNQEVDIRMTIDAFPRWAAEIAAGNEYLAEKRIVHGDLAARNVLLTFDMHAKICDFGLARHMINYEYNMSTHQRLLLPWKWMAPESLSHRQYSSASDVWAFGVTCWEIFSMGGVPYAGMTWSLAFVDELGNGTRLARPNYASEKIYRKLLRCWAQNRRQRPGFGELKQFFRQEAVRRTAVVPPFYANVTRKIQLNTL